MLSHAKKLGLAAAVVAMTAIALPLAAQAGETVDGNIAAIVNGDKILKGDVLNAMKGMSVKKEDTEKAFPLIVDQMVNEKLLDGDVAKSGVEKDPAFTQRMEMAKIQVIKSIYLENFLKEKVSEKAVKAEYDKFKKENQGKKEVHARHILVQSEEEAKQVIKELDGGAKFAELAKKRSSGPTAQNGGDVGYFAEGEIIPEFSKAAFALKTGTYTKTPVKSQFGWHVISVEDKRDRAVPELKDVETQIRQKLSQQAIQGKVMELRAKAEIKRFGFDGKPLQETKKN